jgi:hypothetical protein
MQPAALQRGAGVRVGARHARDAHLRRLRSLGGAVQVDFGLPMALKRVVSTLEPMK